VILRRGREKTVCARGADLTLLGSRSTSPLDSARTSMPTSSPADISPVLKRLIAELHAGGLDAAARELEGHCFAAYTSSSEWLGEVGAALNRFRSGNHGRYAQELDPLIDQCLREVGKVWPHFGAV
jgi:hypothetical protein